MCEREKDCAQPLTQFPTLNKFLELNQQTLNNHAEFKDALNSFNKRILQDSLNEYTDNEHVELLYKYRPYFLCPSIAPIGMNEIFTRNERAIDPPLVIIGNVKEKAKETILSYYFVWDHDTPLGKKINIEKIWLSIDSSHRISDLCCHSHYRNKSLLRYMRIRPKKLLEDWHLIFRLGTHGPGIREGKAYKGYAVLYFDFKDERKNGKINFYRARIHLNGEHGWRFPEIWVPMWICCYRDLIRSKNGSFQCPNIRYEDFITENNNRVQISKYSLMSYSLKKQFKAVPRPISDRDLLYPS